MMNTLFFLGIFFLVANICLQGMESQEGKPMMSSERNQD